MENKEELIESQMEKLFCIWMYEDAVVMRFET